MFWWFERGGAYSRGEVLTRADGTYELRFIDPDGVERVEYFADPYALENRQKALAAEFNQQGWTGPHGALR